MVVEMISGTCAVLSIGISVYLYLDNKRLSRQSRELHIQMRKELEQHSNNMDAKSKLLNIEVNSAKQDLNRVLDSSIANLYTRIVKEFDIYSTKGRNYWRKNKNL